MQGALYAIIDFSRPLYCASELLGASFDIVVGEHKAQVRFPSLPTPELHETPLNGTPLVGPSPGEKWTRGQSLISWGNYCPAWKSDVEGKVLSVLAEIEPIAELDGSFGEMAYPAFAKWLDLFEKYVFLQTKQTWEPVNYSGSIGSRSVEIVVANERGPDLVRSPPGVITINLIGKDRALYYDEALYAANMASQGLSPRLEYLLLLNSYFAWGAKDFRKAVLEAACGLEICLKRRIEEELRKLGKPCLSRLMKRHGTLGYLFDLAQMLEIVLPRKNYTKLIVERRNKVAHKASRLREEECYLFLKEVEGIMRRVAPNIHEDDPQR